MINKLKAIFISFLVISLSFISAISLSSYNVSSFPFANAQQYGWCLETKDGKTCQLTYTTECKGSVYPQRPNECRPVTCILPDGKCEENVPYKTCIEEFNGKEDMQNLCAKGCCGVANRKVGVVTYAECLATAEKRGFDESYIQWYGGLTNERECSLKFAGKDRGCCVSTTCKYTTREECQAEFFENTFCYQVDKCYVKSKFKLGCGVMSGDEDKICWFDNLGNQEECIDTCDYPAYTCAINNVEGYKLKKLGGIEEKGYNWSSGTYTKVESGEIQVFGVYCKSTSCDLSGSRGSQKLKWEELEREWLELWGKGGVFVKENKQLKIEFKSPPNSLLSGHSICYNFYTVGDKKDDTWKDFPARSTGLQNQILRCVNGEVVLEGLGVDRKLLCFEGEGFSTFVEENKYEKCFNPRCGGEGAWDIIYDFFVAGVHATRIGFWGYVPAGIAKAFGKDKVGSCTPNACEEEKFSNGESVCIFKRETPIDSACVPRYPPGTTEYCNKCRDTGDYIFNFCEEEEAYALGDCGFEKYDLVEQGLHLFITFILLFFSIWFGLIPIAAIWDCGITNIPCWPVTIVAYSIELFTSLRDIIKLIWYEVLWVFEVIKSKLKF